MAKIIIEQKLVTNPDDLIKLCPFGAIEYDNEYLSISAACKMCNLCVKKGPQGVFTCIEEPIKEIDKSVWRGITVYVDHTHGHIHPVTYELIGKAKELAAKIKHPVYCLFIGHNLKDAAHKILAYGVDEVFLYDDPELQDFRIEPYTAFFEDFINKQKPSIILVGSTNLGRSLAPRVAARFGTGLTADCTVLDVSEDTNLAQIRPAFGGNIMAHIYTPNHRPQFATVRYKVFSAPQKISKPTGKLTLCEINKQALRSRITVLGLKNKEKIRSIEDAEVLIVAGRAVKNQKDLGIITKLAEMLGGMVAVTRPLIESGLADARLQIGLSGRTAKPKLLIACGVSGAIQFVAGMDKAEVIIAINKDENAPIFNIAHYGIIGDIFEIIPQLIEKLESLRQS